MNVVNKLNIENKKEKEFNSLKALIEAKNEKAKPVSQSDSLSSFYVNNK